MDLKHKIINIIELHKKLVNEFEALEIEKLINIYEVISKTLKKNGCVYLCGNGGSAADAQHVAAEFIGRFKKNRIPLPAVALTTDTSILTCISNDFDFKDIYSRQVDALIKEDDILWVFSTSGSSANIIAAVKSAKKKKAKVIAFTGIKGSELEKISNIFICANTTVTSIAQEIHQVAYHIICELVDSSIFSDK